MKHKVVLANAKKFAREYITRAGYAGIEAKNARECVESGYLQGWYRAIKERKV